MRTRLISLLTAGALAVSSLVIAGTVAQAADETTSTISGTIHLPKGYALADATSANHGYVYADEVVRAENGLSRGSEVRGVPNANGSYSLTVKRGSTYMVWALPGGLSQGNHSDLLPAVAGGYLTESTDNIFDNHTTDLSDPAIAKYTVTGDITVDLAMTVGAKITGTVYMPDGTPVDLWTNGNVGVARIPVSGYVDGTWIAGHYASTSATKDGSYSFTGVPGRDYIINALGYDYPTVWLGGYVGSHPTLPDAHVTQVTAPASGQTKTGQNISLVEGSSISGRLIWENLPEGQGTPDSDVTACIPQADGSLTDCQSAYTTYDTDFEGGNYTITGLVPGATYVVVGGSTGYTRTWYGGFVGQNPGVAGQNPVLPNPGVKEVVAAGSGGNVQNIDIVMKRYDQPKVVETFDSQGGISFNSVTIAQGDTVILPVDPTKDGYVFGGWYTQKDGAGTQFTAGTVVDADVTMYAWWKQQVKPAVTIGSVTISGKAAYGQKLTAAASVSPSDSTLTYTWYLGTTRVGTGQSYVVAKSDLGTGLSVTVAASKTGYTSASKASAVKQVPTCTPFSDVEATNTFVDAICWVSSTGITKGTGDGSTYSPTAPVNRGSMAAFLYRLAGSPKWDPPTTSPFVDVKTTNTFYSAITWLYAQKVTVGTTVNGKVYYQPGNAVNRGSMSAFLYRMAGSPKWTTPASSPFTDVLSSNTFYPSITWLADKKITVGSTVNGKLIYQPSNPVNRGAMAAFMQRLAKTDLQCTKFKTAVGC